MAFSGSPFSAQLVTNSKRIDGCGKYHFDMDGTIYEGEIRDGLFHGEGILIFANGDKFIASWDDGKLIDGHLVFSDGLVYRQKQDWKYCQADDRRFQNEINQGKIPAAGSMNRK